MKLVVVGSYPIVRKGIISIITNQTNINFVGEASTIMESIKLIEKTKPDIVMADALLNKGNSLELFMNIRSRGISSKFILLGFCGDIDFIIRSLEEGVEGYMLREADPNEIIYAIKQVQKGKRYVDTDLIRYIYKNRRNHTVPILTSRENEILIALGEGMSNRQISEKFFITEHTVKKHVSQILFKLELRDRTQAAIYAHNNKLVV